MLKVGICIYFIIKILWHFFINALQTSQMKKPLPKEVEDVYDTKRYNEFIQYKKEYREISLIEMGLETIFMLVLVFSNFFSWVSSFESVYVGLWICIGIDWFVGCIFSIGIEFYETFHIEEKYGLNKKTKKEFIKDFVLNQGFEALMNVVLYTFFVFVLEHLSQWTNGFTISLMQCIGFLCILVLVFVLLMLIFSYLSFVVMMKQYHFVDLEDEKLLEEIQELLKGSKKKVKHIKVYDESSKSTTKNAFVLRLPFYRMIGIADNFLNENSHNELLGVLAHEAGHLKHKKQWYNYGMYCLALLAFVCLLALMQHPEMIFSFVDIINQSFSLSHSVYFLYFFVFGLIFEPLFYVIMVIRNNVVRKEEYEADQNVVKEGYQQDLIDLFKSLSKDELVNVNPHPLIEFLEYDHPGMANRIRALKN